MELRRRPPGAGVNYAERSLSGQPNRSDYFPEMMPEPR
jgi:hypothetical protein